MSKWMCVFYFLQFYFYYFIIFIFFLIFIPPHPHLKFKNHLVNLSRRIALLQAAT